MKVLVMSDTHKDLTHAGLAIRHMMKQELDAVIHCGDHLEDAKKLEKQYPQLKFFYVPGNCDGWFFQEDEKIKVINIEDKKVLITHGDRHKIKLNYNMLFEEVNKREADIGLCGHSHLASIETQQESGKMIINPGSISFPRDSKDPSYAVLEIQKGKPIEVKMMRIIDKESIQNES